jgi:hypothetical protein
MTRNLSNLGLLDIWALEVRETDRKKDKKENRKTLCQGTFRQPYYQINQKELLYLARTYRLCGMWLSQVL